MHVRRQPEAWVPLVPAFSQQSTLPFGTSQGFIPLHWDHQLLPAVQSATTKATQ
jgi:hypothetical protein